MGARIFIESLRLVIQKWQVILRLSWFWALLLVFHNYLLLLLIFEKFDETGPFSGPSFLVTLLLSIVLWIVGGLSIAIGWHRHIIMGEMPSARKVINSKWPYRPYLIHSVQIGLLLLLLSIPVLILGLFSSSSILRESSDQQVLTLVAIFAVILVFLVNWALAWLFLRIGLVLPAAAVGKAMSFHASIQATEPIRLQLIVTAGLVTLMGQLPELVAFVSDLVTYQFDWIGEVGLAVLSILFVWINLFVGIGVLSIAYDLLAREKQT